MFKVGDRVRRINGGFKWLKEGMVLEIISVVTLEPDNWRRYNQTLGFDSQEIITDGFTSDQFELVNTKPYNKEDWM